MVDPRRKFNQSLFRVVGIALVVDQRGKQSRMAMRYPALPPEVDKENVFFRLESGSMAKLFRPKAPLCGQPMTLSVGGTVFCCRAILMHDEPTNSVSDEAETEKNELVLFSVIVALVSVDSDLTPISGWFQGNVEHQSQTSGKTDDGTTTTAGQNSGRASASFLGIRKVHISLERLCRVLEREERRCNYVSLQSDLFPTITQQLRSKLEEHQKHQHNQAQRETNSATTSPISLSTKGQGSTKHHRRTSSLVERGEKSTSRKPVVINQKNDALSEQQIFEAVLTSSPPVFSESGLPHQGNLARELMDVFHSLSRTDDIPPTSLDILTARSGTVYINQHVAVAIESISIQHGYLQVWPYQTILFPKVTPAQLLESMSTTAVAPRRLYQFLTALNPRKALVDLEVNLPLPAVMELAEYLVAQGVAKAFSPLAADVQLACVDVSQIQRQSLAFNQTFHTDMSLIVLVSFVTSDTRTIGDCTSILNSDFNDRVSTLVRDGLESASNVPNNSSTSTIGIGRDSNDQEEVFIQMVSWLLARGLLVHLQEYLVAVGNGSETDESTLTSEERTKTDGNIYERLSNAGHLKGKTSINMCAWFLGIEVDVLRDWALQNMHVRLVRRAHSLEE